MKHLNSKELKEFIQDIYKRYINGENVNDTARKIFLDYASSENLIENELYESILYLETIGWDLDASKDEAKEILNKLENKSIRNK